MVYLMVEQQFAKYPWCQRTIRGIFEEVRKRRIHVQEVSELPGGAEERSCVLLVGASEEWINQTARGAGSLGLHPIVLSNRETNSSGLSVSSVKMDIHSSMELAVDYLRTLDRERLALFGVNPSASSDLWRARRFGELTGREGDVFFLGSSVNEIFDQFYEKIHRYDGVICASDYAAVSLVGRLREKNYAIPEKLYVVGYGDMFLSRLFRPSITSISDDYESFGKAALAICAMMEKNDAFSVVSVKLKSRLHIRETTENRPYLPDSRPVVPVPIPENRFFGDMEFTKLANLETMFNECDETDFMLLHLLPQELSYSVMAQQCFISETAAKYRVKKMQKLCGAYNRDELTELILNIILNIRGGLPMEGSAPLFHIIVYCIAAPAPSASGRRIQRSSGMRRNSGSRPDCRPALPACPGGTRPGRGAPTCSCGIAGGIRGKPQ